MKISGEQDREERSYVPVLMMDVCDWFVNENQFADTSIYGAERVVPDSVEMLLLVRK